MSEWLEWATACLPLDPAAGSGDRQLVAPFSGGILLAVIDGLGHGYEAALAAERAIDLLQQNPGQPVLSLMRLCHGGLRKTRGAVMSLVSVDLERASVTWTGVGNVECILVGHVSQRRGRNQALQARGGVVGYQLPPLKERSHELEPGDLLILTTDGIRSSFSLDYPTGSSPQQIADFILSRHARGNDDALVLVARWMGPARL